MEYLDDVLVLSGAGVGGGSHVYANTLYVPPRKFFDAPVWAGITDWADELAPCIDQATRMLGVTRYPYLPTDVDRHMRAVAVEIGRGETFNPAPVGVYFGQPGVEADDPYLGGAGPRRTGCISCGNCNNGCGHNAKNKLTTNYLYLAEALGAAHAYGTAKLLHHMQHKGRLNGMSGQLGQRARTNSEELLAVTRHGSGAAPSVHIPIVEDFVDRLAAKMDSREGALLFEVINRGASAHFVGGVPIGDSAESGAVDPYLRTFGQPGLHVMDGSAMPANPGVNPSLTITALVERAMSLWPNKGDPDPRPPLGSGYARVAPIESRRPAVPAGAPGELRLDARKTDIIPDYPY